MSTRPPVFYGWVVVAACTAVTFCLGEVMWSFGVFFTSIEQEFGWSRAMVSAGFTFLILGHSSSAILAGRLSDKNAARPVLLTSAVLAGVTISLCSQIQSATQFYVLFFVAGLGTGATISVPTSTVQRWFENRPHSGTALAIVMAGVGMGSLVSAPLFRYLIATQGWRPTFVFAGAIFLLLVGAAGALKRPYAAMAAPESDSSPQHTAAAAALPARKLVFTRQFLVLLSVFIIGSLAIQVLTVHLVPYATDIGVSARTAAIALGMIGGASVPGRLLAGVISERLGWSRTLVSAQMATAVATACLTFIGPEWALVCVVALFGIFYGIRAVATLGLMGRVFGTGSLGELIGISIALGTLLSSPGPYIVGYWFDLGNSYTSTFVALALMLALVALLVLRMGSTGPLNAVSEQESSAA